MAPKTESWSRTLPVRFAFRGTWSKSRARRALEGPQPPKTALHRYIPQIVSSLYIACFPFLIPHRLVYAVLTLSDL